MRFPGERIGASSLTIALLLSLGGCGALSSDGRGDATSASAASAASAVRDNNPSADYPVVLGDPYTVDGKLFTPEDTLNYDFVGYAASDRLGGDAVSGSHRTLPLPSYVEVTSLDSGRTILVRIERRGMMYGNSEVGLSNGAFAQLGASLGAPVRVRRVLPPEFERAKLRGGEQAAERMATPQSLLGVLRRKLPAGGFVPGTPPPIELAQADVPAANTAIDDLPELPPAPARTPADKGDKGGNAAPVAANDAPDTVVGAPALPPLDSAASTEDVNVVRAGTRSANDNVAPRPVTVLRPAATSGFMVQAAAFSEEARAKRAAGKLNGKITKAGRFYRVRTGPFASRGEAESSLAKVRAAGYSDAKILKK